MVTFIDAWHKIRRAERHIAELAELVDLLPRKYISRIEQIPDGRGTAIWYEIPDFTTYNTSIALITGDAIHNLRTALDYAWTCAVGEATSFSKFPIYESLHALKSALQGSGLDVKNSELYRLVTEDIKPCMDGCMHLWLLHRVDIEDKHRLLLPVSHYGSIEGLLVSDSSGPVRAGSWGFQWSGQCHIDLAPGISVIDVGTPTFNLYFGEESKGRGHEIEETLRIFQRTVAHVINTLSG